MESKTYKASNGETKMQLYTPWGERRYPTAASEISTRYRYTGQYEYSELGLYFYQSRWYDAALGRFAQADTIVPLASQGVQALDRYAYVNNSPVNFVDPTGRDLEQILFNKRELPKPTILPSPGVTEERHNKLLSIKEYAEYMSTLMKSGEITDVEALARILEFAAPMYGNDVYDYLRDLGIVIGGLEIRGSALEHILNYILGEFQPADAFSYVNKKNPLYQYYVGIEAFKPVGASTGFQAYLNPNNDNQVRHFIAGAAGGSAFAGLGQTYMLEDEQSEEDKALYQLSFEFVSLLVILDNPLSVSGDWVRYYIGR